MDRNIFKQLSKPSRIQYVMDEGEMIHEIKNYPLYTSLFLMQNFYVEIYLNVSSNEISKIEVQDDPDKLYLYLQDLSLKEVSVVSPN